MRQNYLEWARKIEIDQPVRYPKYLFQLLERIACMRRSKQHPRLDEELVN